MDISPQDMVAWRKKIELIGFDIKGLEQDTDPSRLKLKTKLINRLGINELDKIGLQLIHVSGTFLGKQTQVASPLAIFKMSIKCGMA